MTTVLCSYYVAFVLVIQSLSIAIHSCFVRHTKDLEQDWLVRCPYNVTAFECRHRVVFSARYFSGGNTPAAWALPCRKSQNTSLPSRIVTENLLRATLSLKNQFLQRAGRGRGVLAFQSLGHTRRWFSPILGH